MNKSLYTKHILSNPRLQRFFMLLQNFKFTYVFFFCLVALPIRYWNNQYAIFPSAFSDLIITFLFIFTAAIVFFTLNFFFNNYLLFIQNIKLFTHDKIIKKLIFFCTFFMILIILSSSIYFSIYLLNIVFLYLTTKTEESKTYTSRIKYISLFLIFLSLSIYLLFAEKVDSLFITSISVTFPIYFLGFFYQRNNSIYFMYRILFSVLFFFSTSVMSPFLLLFGLLAIWVTKIFYLLLLGNSDYPSLYRIYNITK